MDEKCVRSIVSINFVEIQWQDDKGVDILLEGPTIFLRVCVLGQLQHTHLHTPAFPIQINQALTFDRVLTNCHDSALYNEVIRGEHVKIELIQVSPNYQGGKILAKFETPAHKFLFPDAPHEKYQQVALDKSRRYRHPPRVTYSCSTSLFEVTVHSPVDSIFASESLHRTETIGQGSSQYHQQEGRKDVRLGHDKLIGSRQTGIKSASNHAPQVPCSSVISKRLRAEPGDITHEGDDDGLDTHDTSQKLHSLLESYLEPLQTKLREENKTSFRVKFKPPVPRFSKMASSKESSYLANQDIELPQHSISPQLYRSVTSKLGPHKWQACPRRSPKRVRSYSAPNSTVHRASLKSSRPNLDDSNLPLTVSDLTCDLKELADDRPPFVVRHPDSELIERRDFCGSSYLSPSQRALGVEEKLLKVEHGQAGESNMTDSFRRHGAEKGRDSCLEGGLAASLEIGRDRPVYLNEHLRMSNEDYDPRKQAGHNGPVSRFETPAKCPLSPKCVTTSGFQPDPILSSMISSSVPRLNKQAHGSARRELVSKYLVTQSGNVRKGVDSPGKLIEEKIKHLKEECCVQKHSGESLGEDDLSEDLDRLKASLQAERNEFLSRSARLLPEKNVTVQIGPRDFWSRRMSEFTGKRHRVLFDETLEKIYNRLYTDASLST